MDYEVHGILQARILEWVAIPFSRGASQPRDQTQVSCIAGGFFTNWTAREALYSLSILNMWNHIAHTYTCLPEPWLQGRTNRWNNINEAYCEKKITLWKLIKIWHWQSQVIKFSWLKSLCMFKSSFLQVSISQVGKHFWLSQVSGLVLASGQESPTAQLNSLQWAGQSLQQRMSQHKKRWILLKLRELVSTQWNLVKFHLI